MTIIVPIRTPYKTFKAYNEYVQQVYDGTLPATFDKWDMRSADEHGKSVAHIVASCMFLPASFTQWDLADYKGWTVAHVAAACGYLPPAFNQWGIRNVVTRKGWAVAHSAAQHGHLPADFEQWDMCIDTADATAVAHIAAGNGKLPCDFSRWGITDRSGMSVWDYVEIQKDEFYTQWLHEKPLCQTKEDWLIFKRCLPEIYSKYAVVGLFNDVNATQETHWL
jgi:hypothetical protein